MVVVMDNTGWIVVVTTG